MTSTPNHGRLPLVSDAPWPGRGSVLTSGESDQARYLELDAAHMLHPYSDPSVGGTATKNLFVSAQGSYVVTAEGQRLFDGNAGLWCVNLGYGNEELIEAIAEQLRTLSYAQTFGQTSSIPTIELAAKLAQLAPSHINRTFFGTGGSIANDTAVRIAHYYHKRRGESGRRLVISLGRAYHGSTLLSASMTRIIEYHAGFQMLDGLVYEAPSPNPYRRESELSIEAFLQKALDELERLIDTLGPENLACIIVEPILGAGGVIVPPPGYHAGVAELCKRNGLLLIADEVVTGFGRLGEWVTSERLFDFSSDIITLAKGITSGYVPLSATMVSDEVHEVLSMPGDDIPLFAHGFTHSGHPVGCATALRSIEIIERDGLLDHVKKVGPHFMERLSALTELPMVGEARGSHFMAAVEIVADKVTKEPIHAGLEASRRIKQHCEERGLIVRPLTDYIILSPPLIMTAEEADWVVDVLADAIVATADELNIA